MSWTVKNCVAVTALIAVAAFAVEKRELWACNASNNGNAYTDGCDCPANESCHPNGSSLTITQYLQLPGECACRVKINASWNCAGPGHDAELRLNGGLVTSGCINGVGDDCRGETWSYVGPLDNNEIAGQCGQINEIEIVVLDGDCGTAANICGTSGDETIKRMKFQCDTAGC